ncbi:LytR/AlgR family response regulator transcription factor [Flavitalea sp.]|nr:LytTR family DNA-binding domain-containing protein [Flavitalea sp.]
MDLFQNGKLVQALTITLCTLHCRSLSPEKNEYWSPDFLININLTHSNCIFDHAKATPLIFQDNKTGDFRLVNLRNAKGLVKYETLELNPQHEKISSFVHALNGAPTATALPNLTSKAVNTQRYRFLVRISSKLRPVSIEDIAYFYADNRLNFLTTWEGQRFVINHSMEDLVRQLAPDHFFRISRSFIVSYKSIDMIQIQDRNRLKVMLTPAFKSEVFVSREKVTEFKSWIGE